MCFRSTPGDTSPDDVADWAMLEPAALGRRGEKPKATESVTARSRPGLMMRPPFSFCCASTAAAACFIRDDVDRDLCSIISDMLRFFRMGFLFSRKELDLVSSTLSIGRDSDRMFLPVCKGPYSQVTSQSFSLFGG